jgi:virulence-associated protein VagC
MDMTTSKLFRTGGSVALRIPAGWLDPNAPVTLVRDERTGRVYLNQSDPLDTQDFFDFMQGQEHRPDAGFDELAVRADPARISSLDEEL